MTDAPPMARPAFARSFPDIRHALTTAARQRPATWDERDEPDVLQGIEQLCSWLGPFLPPPASVALAARELAGRESAGPFGLDHREPAAILADLPALITYLAMVGAALECITERD